MKKICKLNGLHACFFVHAIYKARCKANAKRNLIGIRLCLTRHDGIENCALYKILRDSKQHSCKRLDFVRCSEVRDIANEITMDLHYSLSHLDYFTTVLFI